MSSMTDAEFQATMQKTDQELAKCQLDESKGTAAKKLLDKAYKSQDGSQFFSKLPGEVRNKIYENLLISEDTIMPQKKLWFGLYPAITRVCRAVFYESFGILYGGNSFRFSHNDRVMTFARALEENRPHHPSPTSIFSLDIFHRRDHIRHLSNWQGVYATKDSKGNIIMEIGELLRPLLYLTAVEHLSLDVDEDYWNGLFQEWIKDMRARDSRELNRLPKSLKKIEIKSFDGHDLGLLIAELGLLAGPRVEISAKDCKRAQH